METKNKTKKQLNPIEMLNIKGGTSDTSTDITTNNSDGLNDKTS